MSPSTKVDAIVKLKASSRFDELLAAIGEPLTLRQPSLPARLLWRRMSKPQKSGR